MLINNDEELVCAYLDNQLTASEKAEFEKRLEVENHLQALLIQFKQADQTYIQADEAQIQSPMPEHILSLLQPAKPKSQSVFRRWPIAASVAAIAITTALLTIQSNDTDSELAKFNALDTSPSSELIWLDEKQQTSMLISLSFQHNNGQYCREFLLDTQGQATRQIACKDQQWKIEVTAPAASLRQNEAYMPAGEVQNNKIEDFLNQSMQGDGLDQNQEQELISRKWQ